jgi:hypothetical protein
VTGYQAFGAGSNSGSYNNVIGYQAGYSNTSGYNNNFIGQQAGYSNIDGYYNTLIGDSANVGSGSLTNATAIGYGATVNTSNSLVLGNASVNVGIRNSSPTYTLDVTGDINLTGTLYQSGVAGVDCTGDVVTTSKGVVVGCGSSDIRYKKDIANISSSTLDKILSLNPVTFHWNDIYKDRFNQDNNSLQFGFIAQDVQSIFPDLVTQDKQGYFSVRYGQMVAILTQGIKELHGNVMSIQNQLSNIGDTLADKIIHVKETVTGVLRVEEKMCVDEVCVTKDQLKQILINGMANSGNNSSASFIPPSSNTSEIIQSTTTSQTTVVSDPTPEVVEQSTTAEPAVIPVPEVVEHNTTPEPLVIAPTPEPAIVAPTPEPVVVTPPTE